MLKNFYQRLFPPDIEVDDYKSQRRKFLSLNKNSKIELIISCLAELDEHPELLMQDSVKKHFKKEFVHLVESKDEKINIPVAWINIKISTLEECRMRHLDLCDDEFFERVKNGKIEIFEAISYPKPTES